MSKNVHPVVLSVPRGPISLSAMRLVVGWVASCNDLPLDQIDDINLALETLVSEEPGEGSELVPLELRLTVESGELDLRLGGLVSPRLRFNLEAGDDFCPSTDWPLDVRIFLRALVDDYQVSADEGMSFAVLMKKRIR